jgi:hypothetical protein
MFLCGCFFDRNNHFDRYNLNNDMAYLQLPFDLLTNLFHIFDSCDSNSTNFLQLVFTEFNCFPWEPRK